MDVRTALLTTACLVLAPLAARAGPDTPESVALDPMTVTPKTYPLDETWERLRRTMESAPCLGCGQEQDAARRSVYEKAYYGTGAVLSFLSGMPQQPPNPSFEERLETRVVGDWRRYERAPAEVE